MILWRLGALVSKNHKRVLICFKLANFLHIYPLSADFLFPKKIFHFGQKMNFLRWKMPKIEFSRGSMIRWWQNFFLHYFQYVLLKLAVITTKNVQKFFFLFFYQNTGVISIFTAFWVIFSTFSFFRKVWRKFPKKCKFLCSHVRKHQISYKSVKIYCFRML